MKQVHLFVSGFVQGVGYRAFVRHLARKMGLTGWARNLSDGRVEVLIQAAAKNEQENGRLIDKMVALCERGPMLSEVERIVIEKDEIKEVFDSFNVVKK